MNLWTPCGFATDLLNGNNYFLSCCKAQRGYLLSLRWETVYDSYFINYLNSSIYYSTWVVYLSNLSILFPCLLFVAQICVCILREPVFSFLQVWFVHFESQDSGNYPVDWRHVVEIADEIPALQTLFFPKNAISSKIRTFSSILHLYNW